MNNTNTLTNFIDKIDPLILSTPGNNELLLDLIYIPIPQESIKKDNNGVITRRIPGFSRYTIDTNGNIFDNRENTYVKTFIDRGYLSVNLTNNNGLRYPLRLHRLVLKAFRPIKESHLYFVNHIDKNRQNNNILNLEWITNGMNIQHAKIEKKGGELGDPVGVICRNVFTGEILEFNHIIDCANKLNLHKDTIMQHMNERPLNYIRKDGWQFKRRYNKSNWDEITREYINDNIHECKYHLKYYNDDNVLIFNTLQEIADHLKCGLTTIFLKLTPKCHKRIKAQLIRNTGAGNRNYKLFYLKKEFDDREWGEYPTIYHAYEDSQFSKTEANVQLYRPIVIIDANGNENVFYDLNEICKFLNIGKTTVLYRTDNPKDRHGNYIRRKDGYIYAFYTDWYNDTFNK